jgi:hypothetical protein
MAKGGTEGNEQLTTITGVVLIVLLAVLGVTILRIHQLIGVHLFVGLLLLGPVALKLASTGYRFLRYYTRDPAYREKGPPPAALRLLAPGVVATTVVVFASGIVLMFLGPAHRQSWLLIHKASFILWLGLTGVHVLGHLPAMATLFGGQASEAPALRRVPGNSARWLTLGGAVVGGLVLAIVLIPHFAAWTAAGSFGHHDH